MLNLNSSASLTLNDWFALSVKKYGDKPAFNMKRDGKWEALTFNDIDKRVRRFSDGLRAVGVKKGDRVAILSENRPEWVVADLAILAAGGITAPIYPTLPPGQVGHILRDSGAVAVIVGDAKLFAKAKIASDGCSDLATFITMDEMEGAQSMEAVGKLGETTKTNDTFEQRLKSIQPNDVAGLIYTSGTTGDPKGAMLTHRNFVAAAQIVTDALPVRYKVERFLSFLPLCHVYERVAYYLCLGIGANTFYAESIFKVQENMMEVHPTVLQSVPRLFESIHERILDVVAKQPPKRQKFFQWAIKTGDRYSTRAYAGRFVSPFLALQRAIADKVVLSKLREKLGSEVRVFISAGAALRDETAIFFNAIGVPVLEAYGMTETTAPITTNRWGKARVGSVGQAFPGVTVKIAPDGEVLMKGPNMMKGYWNAPEATAEMIDKQGWLHTGDIGVLDKKGYLTITDRKKDILVLANGKNVAPQPIEGKLKQAQLVSEIVLLESDGGVGAIVIPDFTALAAWAKDKGLAAATPAELAALPEARREIKKRIDAVSGDLAEFERPRKIALIDHALSIEAGELTPTLKVKRKAVRERYGALLG